MIKRILWPVFAVLTIFLSLAGCGKKGDLEPPGKARALLFLQAPLETINKD